MAISGNKYVGADLAVSLGGSLVEQAVVKSASISESKDVHDSSGAGGGAKTFLGGEQAATLALDLWSTDDDSDVRDLIDLTDDDGVAVIVYPNGNTTGQIVLTFSVIWTGIQEVIEKNAVVGISVTGQISGAIVRSTA